MARQIRNGYIDLNSILMGFNLLIMGLIVFAFVQTQGNKYINQETIVLGVILSVQTHVALLLERKRRDPFVILLAFTMIFYFSFRIATLTLYPYSVVFNRYPFDADNSNYALIFIIIANIFLYSGLYVVKFITNPKINPDKWRATSAYSAVFLAIASIILRYSNYWTGDNIPRVLNFLILFMDNSIIMLMVYAYWVLFKESSGRLFLITFAAVILFDALLHSLAGSRGAIVNLILNYGLVVLGVAGSIKLNKKYFFFGLALLPVFVVFVFSGFVISSTLRVKRGTDTSFNLARSIEVANETILSLQSDSRLNVILPPIFDRLGYFDYSAEIIAHKEQYDKAINISSYVKSIIDNLLTPGFDIFDQPKISNALRFIYADAGPPMKSIVAVNYHSDQLGLYGELYALFEYASMPLFFFIAFLLKRVYVGLKGTNPFNLAIKRIAVLYVFSMIINSFGFDWTIVETLPFASIFIYRFFFQSRLYTNSPAHSI